MSESDLKTHKWSKMPTEDCRIPEGRDTNRCPSEAKQPAALTPNLNKNRTRQLKGLPPLAPLASRTVDLASTHKSHDNLNLLLKPHKRGVSPSQSIGSLSTGYTSDGTNSTSKSIRIDTKKPSLYARHGDTETVLADFHIKRMIGQGSFGKVYLIERKAKPGDVYAMKVIQKTTIIEEDMLESAQLESQIM